MQEIKESVHSEFRERWGEADRLLRLALNEAEAVACQTEFPLLVFPVLAREKAERVASWQQRQRTMLRGQGTFGTWA